MVNKLIEKFYWFLAQKLLPRKLVHFCFVIVATYSSVTAHSDKEFGTITVLEANQVWCDKYLKGKTNESINTD